MDVTPLGVRRALSRLREFALRTGLNVVAATGYYVAASHPHDFKERTVESIASKMVNDLCAIVLCELFATLFILAEPYRSISSGGVSCCPASRIC